MSVARIARQYTSTLSNAWFCDFMGNGTIIHLCNSDGGLNIFEGFFLANVH